jgi:non-canonical poly(A) RNA polymerase PAPD5/7
VLKVRTSPAYDCKWIDLTLQDRRHLGLECVQLVKRYLDRLPLLKPLVIVLKKFIYAGGLADPYQGGLSSYSLTLMVVALLLLANEQLTLGQAFLHFLRLYGIDLDYSSKAIFVPGPDSP